MAGSLTTWQALMAPEMELLRTAASGISAGGAMVAELAALRARYPAKLVAAAIELAGARRRGEAKFGLEARSLAADRPGMEMATSATVGAHKSARFRRVVAGDEAVADLCCGIGGDAMAMMRAGVRVIGVDTDPVRAWMCAQNAGCEVRCSRVEDEGAWNARWFHLDPARRDHAGMRRFRLEDLSPGPEAWRGVLERARRAAGDQRFGGAIKLGPGVDVGELRAVLGAAAPLEVEYISENGRMAQAVAWLGSLAGEHAVRATRVTARHIDTIAGEAARPERGELGRYLVETDDAVERAGLLVMLATEIRGCELWPGLGLLTADEVVVNPWCAWFQIVHRDAWNERRAARWLEANSGGVVEIKTRGSAVDPDVLQRRLRGSGGTTYTVFVLRLGRAMECFITRRVAARSA